MSVKPMRMRGVHVHIFNAENNKQIQIN